MVEILKQLHITDVTLSYISIGEIYEGLLPLPIPRHTCTLLDSSLWPLPVHHATFSHSLLKKCEKRQLVCCISCVFQVHYLTAPSISAPFLVFT